MEKEIECIFPRIYKGEITPRITEMKLFPRIMCLITLAPPSPLPDIEFSLYDENGNEVDKIEEDRIMFAKGSAMENGTPMEGKRIYLATEDDSVALCFDETDIGGIFEISVQVNGVDKSENIIYQCFLGDEI